MLDVSLWLIEGGAVAVPAAATILYAGRVRRRIAQSLNAPLFWDGGQPVSLVTVFNELNGEADLAATLAERLGLAMPLTPVTLGQAVETLQATPAVWQGLLREVATDVTLRGAPPAQAAEVGAALLDRLETQSAQLGFFAFVASLNAERPAHLPALLPMESLQPGGLPLAAPAGGEPRGPTSGGVLGVLGALGLGRQGDWLPGVIRAVEDLVRARRVAKAKAEHDRALSALGAIAADALRRRSLAGQQLRRNIFSPLDAYRNLETRAKAERPKGRAMTRFFVPSVEQALWQGFFKGLQRATSLVADKCAALERTLTGRQGHLYAGELLFAHRESLLAGVAPDAFPIAAVQATADALERARADVLRSEPTA